MSRQGTLRILLLVPAPLLLIVGGVASWKAWKLDQRLSRSVERATKVRVWAAGIRTNPDGRFCACAVVPKPERMLDESSNEADIRALVSAVRARPHFQEDPLYETCATVTIDFLRDDQLILSLHLMGATVRSTCLSWWQIPVSTGSREDIEAWLSARGLRAKADAATEEFFRSLSK